MDCQTFYWLVSGSQFPLREGGIAPGPNLASGNPNLPRYQGQLMQNFFPVTGAMHRRIFGPCPEMPILGFRFQPKRTLKPQFHLFAQCRRNFFNRPGTPLGGPAFCAAEFLSSGSPQGLYEAAKVSNDKKNVDRSWECFEFALVLVPEYSLKVSWECALQNTSNVKLKVTF